MSSTTDDAIPLTASCLCRAHTYRTTIPRSSLPLNAHICHCTTCRHITGSLYSSSTYWPDPPSSLDLASLKRFSFTKAVDALSCPTCSSSMFFVFPGDDTKLGVLTGVLSNVDEELVKFGGRAGGMGFVRDTMDGGASPWLMHANADSVPLKWFEDGGLRCGDAKEMPANWPPQENLTGYSAKKEDAIPIRCKCKGVDFVLHRGDYEGVEKEDLPWNIDPVTHKLLVGMCACISCRLQSGVDVFYWTFSEMKNISFPPSSSHATFPTHMLALNALIDTKDPAVGTLTYYNSSPNAYRYFCRTCSACVFYAKGARPTFVDIAVGALEASDGARAEGMLSWPFGARLVFQEDGDGGWREGLYERVRRGAEEYRIQRGYAKNYHRLELEQEAAKKEEQ